MGMDMSDILQHRKQPTEKASSGNAKASALTIVGYIVLVIGVLVGLLFAMANEDPMRWIYSIGTILFAVMSGVFLIGIGEVINILQDIRNKQRGTEHE